MRWMHVLLGTMVVGCAAGSQSHSRSDTGSADASIDAPSDAGHDAAPIDAPMYADAQSPECNVQTARPYEGFGFNELKCWTRDKLRKSTEPPLLTDPAGWPIGPDGTEVLCPTADVFRWGPDGESCAPVAICNQPQPTQEADTCCYVTNNVCGV